jgi:competence protein ComEA
MPALHPKRMKRPNLRTILLSLLASSFVLLTACTNQQDNPDEIRRRTAEATETMRRDTKAVVEGVKEGMGRDNKAVNINKASREDLLSLPGLTEREADRIIADRPFDDTHDLVRRRIVSEAEYDKIHDRVIADR